MNVEYLKLACPWLYFKLFIIGYYQPSLLIDGKNISNLDHLVSAKEREITCSPAQGVQNENTTLSVVVEVGNDEKILYSNMALNTTMTSMTVYIPGGSLWASITCIAFAMESRLWKSVLIDVYGKSNRDFYRNNITIYCNCDPITYSSLNNSYRWPECFQMCRLNSALSFCL